VTPPYVAAPTADHAVAVAVADGVWLDVGVCDAVIDVVDVREDDCVIDAGVDVILGVGIVSVYVKESRTNSP